MVRLIIAMVLNSVRFFNLMNNFITYVKYHSKLKIRLVSREGSRGAVPPLSKLFCISYFYLIQHENMFNKFYKIIQEYTHA